MTKKSQRFLDLGPAHNWGHLPGGCTEKLGHKNELLLAITRGQDSGGDQQSCGCFAAHGFSSRQWGLGAGSIN
jgi:hypothetical protein